MGYAKIKLLAGSAVLLTTLGFGLYPFNFLSRNDVAFDPKVPGLRFHSNAHKKGYSQQAVAYTDHPVHFSANQPITILIESIPSKIPDGLGTLIEFHDGHDQPPLIVAQWRNHLAIRSRRLNRSTGRAYQEIGLSDCLKLGQLVSLTINYTGSETRIFTNGELAATKKGYHLLDTNFSLDTYITIGNNATGERAWIGTLKRIAIYEKSITPIEMKNALNIPFIEYVFDRPFSELIPNRVNNRPNLRIPIHYNPLEPKAFAVLSSFEKQGDWQSSDIVINFFGFIPASAVIFFMFLNRTKILWLTPISTAAGAFTLSLIIEYSQIALPSRSPSYVDLFVNTLAGFITALILFVITWKRERDRFSSRFSLPTN